MKESKDKFANKFYGSVTESAANTLSFAEIPTNVDVFAKSAWVLHRLEWYIPEAVWDLLVASADSVQIALTSSRQISTLKLDNSAVIDLLELMEVTWNATSILISQNPIIRDFTGLPGGGLIIAPRPLYIAVKGTSLTAAVDAELRGYFTRLDLTADEYIELVDFYRIVG